MFKPTDIQLGQLAAAVEAIDKLFEEIGVAETYDENTDHALHYQLGKVSDILHFSILQELLKRKELI